MPPPEFLDPNAMIQPRPGGGPGNMPPGMQTQGPAVQIVNRMITDAVRLGASDIHIEPRRGQVDVRFRVDGVLQLWSQALTKDMQDMITARVKVMAELDINEKRLPQDGRITFNLPGRAARFACLNPADHLRREARDAYSRPFHVVSSPRRARLLARQQSHLSRN